MGFNAKFFLLGVLLVGATYGQSAVAQNTAITVLVYNAAHVSRSSLNTAEREAASIFRSAGIPITWVECPSEAPEGRRICRQELAAREFVLRIVSHGKTRTDSVFGVAFLDEGGIGKYCDLFLDRVQSMQTQMDIDEGRLLGAVAVHELGHLLLGTHSHSAFGIMAPRWQLSELESINRGDLYFDTAQKTHMRSRILDLAEPRQVPQLTSRTRIE